MDGKKNYRINDMTNGDPKKLIFMFALPLMGGNFLQQLYTVVDAAIVGQGVGVNALAAVGSTEWIYCFVIWAAGGFGQGFSVVIATAFGEKNYDRVKRSINMALGMSVILGIILSAAGVILANPLLKLLNTPENIFDDALTYVSIMYVGILAMTISGTFGGILRALGDSRSPFIALIISTIMNISLDLLFIIVFHWGVAGAAIASVLAQIGSGLYNYMIFKRLPFAESSKDDWRIDKRIIKSLWNKGLATAFQYSVIAVGGVVVQYGLNSMGFLYVAGFTAANKLNGILNAISLAMGSAMMIYTGQNYGAGDKERIKQGARVSTAYGIVFSVVLGAVLIIFGRQILMLFIDIDSNVANEVLDIAYKYLFNMSVMLAILYIVNTYRNIMMALNGMPVVVFTSIMELITRIVMTIVTLTVIGELGVYFIDISAWACGAAILFIAYCIKIKHIDFFQKKTGE